ncbi:MAG: AMP-binding protein [Aquabacterium sp.]
MTDHIRWADIPYHLATPAVPPQAECLPRADGGWLLRCPVAFGANSGGQPRTPWQWFAQRRHDDGVMLGQRGPDGAWRTLTWRDAWDQAGRLATALRDLGLGPGRPIATLSGNAIEQGVLRLACMAAQVPMLHLSPAWSLLSQDFAALKSASTRVPPAAAFVQQVVGYERALAALAEVAPGVPVLAVQGARAGDQDWAALLATDPDTALLQAAADGGDDDALVSVYFTSGSTGTPKAVPVTQGMLAGQITMVYGLGDPAQRRPQVVLDWLPWHHAFAGVANLSRLLVNGGTYWIDDGRPLPGQFEATLRNLRDIAPTNYASSPLALTRIVAALEQDDALARQFFSRLTSLAYGGASLPGETWERWQRLALRYIGKKIPFLCGLGSTESSAAGMSLYWPSDDTSTVGLPWPGCDVRLVPLEGQQGTRGGRFEMRMRGPHIFKGYIGRPDLTAAAFDEEGFYRIGDAVRFLDPADPLRGLQFAGRVAEDFKLGSGSWVMAGAMRLQAVSLLSPLVTDGVVCGHDRDDVGLLAWPAEAALRALDPALAALPMAELVRHPVVLQAVQRRLDAAAGEGGATHILARVLLLPTPPDAASGEITDKGYVNQARAVQLRVADVERLYADPVAAGVVRRG